MEIKELAALLEEKINFKMDQFDEHGHAIKLGLFIGVERKEIDRHFEIMAKIARELEPVLYVVKMQYPRHGKLLDALLNS